jgi:hypothetical protein
MFSTAAGSGGEVTAWWHLNKDRKRARRIPADEPADAPALLSLPRRPRGATASR